MAQKVDIEVFSGNTVLIDVTVTDGDSVTPAMKNLTGATPITFVVAPAQGKPPTVTKQLAAGIVVTDAPGGKFRVTLAPADTEPLKGALYHECRVVDATGAVSTVMYGVFTVQNNSIV